MMPRTRQVYDLHLEGLTVGEIAHRLGMNQKTVRVHLHHARYGRPDGESVVRVRVPVETWRALHALGDPATVASAVLREWAR